MSLILLVAETGIEPVTIKIGRRCKFYQLYTKYKIKFFCLNSVLLIFCQILPKSLLGENTMSTMNISLPDQLKSFVDERVSSSGYGTSSEYLRELIRRDQDRLSLRAMMLDGASSPITGEADNRYFDYLRSKVNQPLAK